MTKIKQLIFNSFQVNCYIIYDNSKEAVIIDGAILTEFDLKKIEKFLNDNDLKIKYILNTHGHLDHICGNYLLKSHFNVPILGIKEDDFLVDAAMDSAALFGFSIQQPPMPDMYIKDEDIIEFGNTKLKVISISGHTPGGICLYCSEYGFLISGDSLFHNSIGRTDLPRGNYNDLISNIKMKLLNLPPETSVFPGHGPSTSIENEIKYNPFF